MNLLRLIWSFGLRRALALWLLPELEEEQGRIAQESWTAVRSGGVIIDGDSETFRQ